MNTQQTEAYRAMHKALQMALREIHNPGFNRHNGTDVVGHIEAVRDFAAKVAPEAWV